jgi:hypothetical protein
MKGLAKRSTRVKYESPRTNQSKVITKVKVFADGRTDRQTMITIGHPASLAGYEGHQQYKINLT